MGAGQIQVLGVQVIGRRLGVPWRDIGPITSNSGDMGHLDLVPQPEPMNPLLKPVMIRGHEGEERDETGYGRIAEAVPPGFIEQDNAAKTGEKNDQTPGGKAGAGFRATTNKTFDSLDEPLQLRNT